MLKNPLLGFSESVVKEIKFLVEFLQLISWVREHLIRKLKIKEIIDLIQPLIQNCREILSRTLGKL